MIDAISHTKLTMKCFEKYRDNDEFLVYKAIVTTNVIRQANPTPLMYLSNKRVWIVNWGLLMSSDPAVINFQKANIILKKDTKTIIGLKQQLITFSSSDTPSEKIIIGGMKNRDAVYEAIMLIQQLQFEEGRYMDQNEARNKLLPILRQI